MKKLITSIALVLALGVAHDGASQSIRKDYREMTTSERDNLMDAFWALGGSNGEAAGNWTIIWQFHRDAFNSIHFQTDFSTDVFFAWHRWASYEIESRCQLLDGYNSLPYWHWPTDNSTGTPLFSNDWLGQFNGPWNLNRSLGGGTLPSQAAMDNLLTQSNFQTFSVNTENGTVHTGGHTWTGGTMASSSSPKDPVFWFHHNGVDKLWADWQEIHGSSSYPTTSLPLFTSVNPNSIVNTRSLGVFYAENQQVTMDHYTVSNSNPFKPGYPEVFAYQYDIDVAPNFTVPNGKDVIVRSCHSVDLLPGFRANFGSNTFIKADEDCDFDTFKNGPAGNDGKPPKGDGYDELIANEAEALNQDWNLEVFPNPSPSGRFIVRPEGAVQYPLQLMVSDLSGRQVKHEQWNEGQHRLSLESQSPGLYILTVIDAAGSVQTQRLVR